MAVFGLVDVECARSKDRNIVVVELEGQIVRNLTAHRDDNSVRILELDDVHHSLEGQFVEIEPVAHVIVGGHGLRVVVDEHSPVALFLDRLQAGYRAPVEFNRGTDPVGPGAKNDC